MVSPTTPERVFLGLGSNLGDREAAIDEALRRLAAIPGTRIVRAAAVRETEPWGVAEQPWFLNTVVEIKTGAEPESLLAAVKAIEREMGRVPGPRWGPRLIDIDLLLYGERRISTPALQLPHPGLRDRSFVREPLAEIAPEVLEGFDHADAAL
jgi:2-amino-4-hydroxy-6-hydroxymethyldihydropteridine diphosphokinase